MTFAADVDACFIGVYQRRLGQTVLDPRLESGGLVESILPLGKVRRSSFTRWIASGMLLIFMGLSTVE